MQTYLNVVVVVVVARAKKKEKKHDAQPTIITLLFLFLFLFFSLSGRTTLDGRSYPREISRLCLGGEAAGLKALSGGLKDSKRTRTKDESSFTRGMRVRERWVGG
jgi:hypothetical protein